MPVRSVQYPEPAFPGAETFTGEQLHSHDYRTAEPLAGFIGLVQPIGAVMPIAEIQSQWVADLLEGRRSLPPDQEMNREIARYRAATARRYGRSAGHAIQVDFLGYLREISKERAGAAWNVR